jgi:Fe-S cluster biogenesis protein NfuA
MLDASAVRQVLEQRVLPLVRADGGEIGLVEATADGVVRVRLSKACSGCPGSQFTVGSLLRRELEALEGFRGVEIVSR